MGGHEPQLREQVHSRTSKETFQRRLSYYIMGLLIGLVLLVLILSARRSVQQQQQTGAPSQTPQQQSVP